MGLFFWSILPSSMSQMIRYHKCYFEMFLEFSNVFLLCINNIQILYKINIPIITNKIPLSAKKFFISSDFIGNWTIEKHLSSFDSFTVICCHYCASWGFPVGLTAGATIPVQPLSWGPSCHKITIVIYEWPTAHFTIWCVGYIYCKMLVEQWEGGDGIILTQAAKVCFTPSVTWWDQTSTLACTWTTWTPFRIVNAA